MISKLGGELVIENDKCLLQRIGKRQGLILPLSLIITRWRQYHGAGGDHRRCPSGKDVKAPVSGWKWNIVCLD